MEVHEWDDETVKPLTKPTLYMVRHGDTMMNDQHLLRGWDDPELDPLGHEQAKKAAEKIAKLNVPLHHIYSGTLKRTRDTAKYVSDATGVGTSETPGLNPWDYGQFTGVKENRKNLKKLKFFQDRPSIQVPQGEGFGKFLDRYGKTLSSAKDYVHKFPEKALVLVTHSRNLYPTRHLLNGKSRIPLKDDEFGPGTIHKIEFAGDGSGKFKMDKV